MRFLARNSINAPVGSLLLPGRRVAEWTHANAPTRNIASHETLLCAAEQITIPNRQRPETTPSRRQPLPRPQGDGGIENPDAPFLGQYSARLQRNQSKRGKVLLRSGSSLPMNLGAPASLPARQSTGYPPAGMPALPGAPGCLNHGRAVLLPYASWRTGIHRSNCFTFSGSWVGGWQAVPVHR